MSMDLSARPIQTQVEPYGHSPKTAIRTAQELLKKQRLAGISALNALFRSGKVPQPLPDGRYDGQFLTVQIAPGLSQIGEFFFMHWQPWRGKTFNAYCHSGENIISKRAFPWLQMLGPLYKGYHEDGPETYQAYAFQTLTGPGREDPDCKVLKIDYNILANPVWTVRRLHDELVQLEAGLYLGKAHFHWWWGRWQMVAFFLLEKSPGEDYEEG